MQNVCKDEGNQNSNVLICSPPSKNKNKMQCLKDVTLGLGGQKECIK